MPQLGETVTEGTITTWSKAVGDPVAIDEALFEVSTEKVDTEVPSAVAGVLRAILVEAGDTVAIGVPVAVITATADEPFEPPTATSTGAAPEATTSEPGSPGSPSEADEPLDPPAAESSGAAPAATTSAPRSARGGAVLTPVVRRLLAEHGLDSASVAGTGRDGRITRADVLAAAANRTATGPPPTAASAAPAPSAEPAVEPGPDDEVVPFSRARAATAAHMRRSLDTAAHALVAVPVDYANVDPVRRRAGLSYLPFVARSVIDALREFPHLNSSVVGEQLVVHRAVHLGIAVDVDREALVVPVVRDAHELRLCPLADDIADLADRARRRRLGGDAFAGGTFTVTNVGAYGTTVTAPIINQPQVAILSSDGVRPTPVAVPATTDPGPDDWAVTVHPVGNLSLSFDHRAVDGAYAAAFLARVRAILEGRDWSSEVAEVTT